MTGRCGPCCSVAPIGTMTMASSSAHLRSSSARNRAHSIVLIAFSRPSQRRVPWPRSKGRQRLHRHVEILQVQTVELVVHGVVENEPVQPAHEVRLTHTNAHMRGASTDHELAVELLAWILFS